MKNPTALAVARYYRAVGLPIPTDLVFDLVAQGIDPETLERTPK